MRLDTPLSEFKNFKGIYTQKEAGLVPDSKETGVYASELQNVECFDGTINLIKGYSYERHPVYNNPGITTRPYGLAVEGYGPIEIIGSANLQTVKGENLRILFDSKANIHVYDKNKNEYTPVVNFLQYATPYGQTAFGHTVDYATFLHPAAADVSISAGIFYGVRGAIVAPDISHEYVSSFFWNGAHANVTDVGSGQIWIDTGYTNDFINPTAVYNPYGFGVSINGIYYGYTEMSFGAGGIIRLNHVTPDPLDHYTVTEAKTGTGKSIVGSTAWQAPDNGSLYGMGRQLYGDVEIGTEGYVGEPGVAPAYFRIYQGRLVVASFNSSKLIISAPGDYFQFSLAEGGLMANLGEGGGGITGLEVYKNSLVVFKESGFIPITVSQPSLGTFETLVRPILSSNKTGIRHSGEKVVTEEGIVCWCVDNKMRILTNVNDGTDIMSVTKFNDDVTNAVEGLSKLRTTGFNYKDSIFFTASSNEGTINDTVLEFDKLNNTWYFLRRPVSGFFFQDNRLMFSASGISATQVNPNLATDGYYAGTFFWEDGYDEDGGATTYLWRSGRHSFGEEFRRKQTNLFGVHMRIGSSTTVTVDIDYGPRGFYKHTTFDVNGDGSSNDSGLYIISSPVSNTYGSNKYGVEPYGSKIGQDEDEGLVEVMAFKSLPINTTPYDITVQFSASGRGQRAKILTYGLNAMVKPDVPKHSLIK